MPYTMEDFRRDSAKKYFPRLTSKERQEVLEHLTAEQRREMLQTLPPEERTEGLPPEERLAGISPKQRLAGIPPEEIRKHLDEITTSRPEGKRKQKKRK